VHASSLLSRLASLFAISAWLGMAACAAPARAQPAVPDALVLRFEASAAALDQPAIREALCLAALRRYAEAIAALEAFRADARGAYRWKDAERLLRRLRALPAQ
jgi:hypothetical protein